MMKARMPLSRSASASQVISTLLSPLTAIITPFALAGGVRSPTAPVLTYSDQAFAIRSFGSQTASSALPVKDSAGSALSPRGGAHQAALFFAGPGLAAFATL